MQRKYTALPDEIETTPRSDTWKDWIIYSGIFAFAGYFLINFIFGADHLIEVISNWFVK